jgi:hypothetical protein
MEARAGSTDPTAHPLDGTDACHVVPRWTVGPVPDVSSPRRCDMGDPRWDEVGDRFSQLGRVLRDTWEETRKTDPESTAADGEQVNSAMERVQSSLDGLADAINQTVHDEEIQDSAKLAASGLVDAISSSLGELADRIEPKKREGED